MLVFCLGTIKGLKTGVPLSRGESWRGCAVSGSSPVVSADHFLGKDHIPTARGMGHWGPRILGQETSGRGMVTGDAAHNLRGKPCSGVLPAPVFFSQYFLQFFLFLSWSP